MTPIKAAPSATNAPRRRERRKEARPGEIIEAALAAFTQHGFAATRMEDVARRAGVSKGTLFVYFATKEELFRAVAHHLLETHLAHLQQAASSPDLPFRDFLHLLLARAATLGDSGIPAMVRMLIAESRAFPDLARVWYDEVVSRALAMLTTAIGQAQSRGEVRAGDPMLHALSILGPMMAGTLFRDIFAGTGATLPDLHELARHHASNILEGLLIA